MLTVIIGGSGSGKSAFAENIVIARGNYRRIYIATMEIFDDECRKRVDRHRKMRSDKMFETIESPTHLENVSVASDCIVLLECMSNLVANEIFSPNGRNKRTADVICDGVEKLNRMSRDLFIVTNDVFSDIVNYDVKTENYIKILGEINCRLAAMADEVYEVVSGLVVKFK